MAKTRVVFALLTVLVTPAAVRAEYSSLNSSRGWEGAESISKLAKSGRHYEAMSRFEDAKPEDLNLSEKLAAAKSAWALGLVNRARALWDEVLADRQFQGPERTRALLGRAILELQEQQYEKARAIAEQAALETEEPGPRSQLWLVIAEALKEEGAYSTAETYYKKAIVEGDKDLRVEATYLLGEVQLELGMLSDARISFAGIETDSAFAPQALRRLAEIDFKQRKWEGVLTWIKEGRQSCPTEFEDPWIHYAAVAALSESSALAEARAELESFKARYSEEDRWVMLASAVYESKAAQKQLSRAKLKEN